MIDDFTDSEFVDEDDSGAVSVLVFPPFYAIECDHECYRCKGRSKVFALIASSARSVGSFDGGFRHVASPVILHSIETIPQSILDAMQRIGAHWECRHSKMAEVLYFMNICRCGAHFGDFFLHGHPDGPFFPIYPESATRYRIHMLSLAEPFELQAEFSEGVAYTFLDSCAKV